MIDNLVHVAHNVKIGENTIIAAMTGISGSCSIGNNTLIGGLVETFIVINLRPLYTRDCKDFVFLYI